jgi:hypothetical protein
MTYIVGVKLVLQSRVSPKARKGVVRREEATGPYRNRAIELPLTMEAGAGSGANMAVRKAVALALKENLQQGEELFYVVAEFSQRNASGKEIQRYFRTVVPRTEIPIQFRRV